MAASSKAELLKILETEHDQWTVLLGEVGPERVNWDAAVGEWSVKDIAAHLATWQSRVVAWLEAIRDRSWPAPPAWRANMSETEINDWIFKANHMLPAADVLAEEQRVYERLLQLVRATPEQDLMTRHRFEWLNGESVAEAMPGNSYEHYQEHVDAVRAWLQRLPKEEEWTNASS